MHESPIARISTYNLLANHFVNTAAQSQQHRTGVCAATHRHAQRHSSCTSSRYAYYYENGGQANILQQHCSDTVCSRVTMHKHALAASLAQSKCNAADQLQACLCTCTSLDSCLLLCLCLASNSGSDDVHVLLPTDVPVNDPGHP